MRRDYYRSVKELPLVGEEWPKGAEWVWTNYDLKAKAPGSLGFLKSYCDDEKSPCLQAWKALQSPHKERSGENE